MLFFEKIKNENRFDLIISAILIALILILSGCGGKTDKEESDTSSRQTEKQETTTVKYTSKEISAMENGTTEQEQSQQTENNQSQTIEQSVSETSDNLSETTRSSTPTVQPTAQPTAQPTTKPTPQPTTSPTTQPPTATAPPAEPAQIKINTPTASGTAVASKNGYIVDYSNSSQGYIMVKGSDSYSGTMAIQVFKDSTGGTLLAQYVASNTGGYTAFSLTGGNGKYVVRVLEQREGGYAPQLTAEFDASISSETVPYTYPTYIVNFNSSSLAVNCALQVCAGCTTDEQKVMAVKAYVMASLEYDYSKAADVKAGNLTYYIPNADSVLSSGKGICYDYSALFAAMLRCQGIPVRLVKGYAGNNMEYHAWNEAYYGGSWHIIDCTYDDVGGMASSYTVTSYN